MRAALMLLCGLLLSVAAATAQTDKPKTLDIYYIDTEGGQSTLFVSPTGESLLVDTGNPGVRDLERIAAALTSAGVKQIDHLWTTHYHTDHVGAMQELAKRFPVMHFYDHGKNSEPREMMPGFGAVYEELSRGKRTTVKPGDKLRMAGLEITTVTSGGQVLGTNLNGGGRPNPACGEPPKDESAYTDPDNGHSAGFVLTYGKFRTIDVGDLTQNTELALMCPTNHIGTVDLYLVTHHGIDRSNSRAIVHALQPRVAIMNNGTRKGGAVETFQILESSPGLEDLWQLHWSYNVGLEHNAAGVFIANIDDNETVAGVLTAPAPAPRGAGAQRGPGTATVPGTPPPGVAAPAAAAAPPSAAGPGAVPGAGTGRPGGGGRAGGAAAHTPAYWVKVSAQPDGTFTVTNARNGFSKTYKAKN